MTPATSDEAREQAREQAREGPRRLFDRVPFIALLGMQRLYSEGGRAQMRLPARPELGNLIGSVHGELLHQADGVAHCRAQVNDEQGRCVARAIGSFRYVPRPAAQPTPV